MDVLSVYPVRKSRKQKQAFRDAVEAYAQEMGYTTSVEKGDLGCRNVIIGDPDKAKYLVTAHYDTPARMLFPNLITPCNFLTFILYQLVVVALFLGASVLVGLAAYGLVQNAALAYDIALLFYIAVLLMMMAGPANPTNANDNTSGVVTVLEIARTLPEMYRDRVCFVLFDLEELGLVGSGAYRKKHKAASNEQTVLNLDCVGDGDHIVFFPFKKASKDSALLAGLDSVSGTFGEKHLLVKNKGFRFYPSDQANFPRGVGIAAFRWNKFAGYYCDKIHTAKDTVLDETNVNLLRAALTTIITNNK